MHGLARNPSAWRRSHLKPRTPVRCSHGVGGDWSIRRRSVGAGRHAARHPVAMPADDVLTAQLQCVIHALGEVDLIGGWVEVALDPGHGVPLGEDYQVLVTSYEGAALFVQNR